MIMVSVREVAADNVISRVGHAHMILPDGARQRQQMHRCRVACIVKHLHMKNQHGYTVSMLDLMRISVFHAVMSGHGRVVKGVGLWIQRAGIDSRLCPVG